MRWAQLFFFGTIGLTALIGGIIWGLESYPIIRDYVSAQGTVVGQEEERNSQTSGFAYYPVVEFTTASNAKVRFRAGAGSDRTPEYEVGTTVDVLYDLRNPANARIGSFKQLLAGPVMATGIGLTLLLLSLLLFVKIGRFERDLNAMGSGNSKRSPSS
jgi:hypothetical protein